jgi:hypothetical protein
MCGAWVDSVGEAAPRAHRQRRASSTRWNETGQRRGQPVAGVETTGRAVATMDQALDVDAPSIAPVEPSTDAQASSRSGRVRRWMSKRRGHASQARPAAVGRGVDGHTPRQGTWWQEGRSFAAEILHVQDLLARGLCSESTFPLQVNIYVERGLRPCASQARDINVRASWDKLNLGGQLRAWAPWDWS